MACVLLYQSPAFRYGTTIGSAAADALNGLASALGKGVTAFSYDHFSSSSLVAAPSELFEEMGSWASDFETIVIAAPVDQLTTLNRSIKKPPKLLALCERSPSKAEEQILSQLGIIALSLFSHRTIHLHKLRTLLTPATSAGGLPNIVEWDKHQALLVDTSPTSAAHGFNKRVYLGTAGQMLPHQREILYAMYRKRGKFLSSASLLAEVSGTETGKHITERDITLQISRMISVIETIKPSLLKHIEIKGGCIRLRAA